jgi:glutamine synthetase
VWGDGSEVVASPRQILRRQLDRLAERGWNAQAATELEFIIFRDTYEQAWHKGYNGLEPANLYNVDYSLLGTSRVEPLLRRIRNEMGVAGMPVEDSKGECFPGQHEINLKSRDALTAADTHVVYKTGAKEIAAQEGNVDLLHGEVRPARGATRATSISRCARRTGTPVLRRAGGDLDSFVAGQLAAMRELTLLFAPNINSYKRYAPRLLRPDRGGVGHDNRTCSLRAVGQGPAKRIENRVPGGDVNPYLALAGMIAAGLHGIEQGLELEPAFKGNAYTADKPTVPSTLQSARDLFAGSELAKAAFGEEVVAHYVNYADVELRAFEATVTEWERFRGFERL